MSRLDRQAVTGFLFAALTGITLAQPSVAGDGTPPRIIDIAPGPGDGVVDQVGLDEIAIVFDETVEIPIDAVSVWSVAGGPVARVGTSYDIGTSTLTITLNTPITSDRVTLIIDDAIADLEGNALDGEILDPNAGLLPSGDGSAGGQAVFRIDVLAGDVNRDGVVDDDDVSVLLQSMGQCDGDDDYDPLADLNADGCINVLDVNIIQGGFGGTLPATDGAGPVISARDPEINAVLRELSFDTVTVTFNEPMDEALMGPGSLMALQPDGTPRDADVFELDETQTVATFTFAPPLDQLGVHALQLSNGVADLSGELLDIETQRQWNVDLDYGPATIIETSPVDGETDVALTRESIITFDYPLEPATITSDSFFATFGGETLPVMLHVSPDNRVVTLFYQEPLPASAIVRVHVIGDLLLDDLGNIVDADGDGIPGGVRFIDFDTITLTTLEGTRVCGRVFASELATSESTGEPVNLPLEGVVITVDGAEDELFAVTDDKGNFCLDPAPVGTFFVHVDGKSATNVDTPEGAYYPFVGKSWTSIAGQEVNVGDVFLPLIVEGTLQEVSDVVDTTITFPDEVIQNNPELAGVEIMVPAGSLFANDGTTGGFVGIAPVDPDRLPGELPPALQFPLVITVQTDAANEGELPPTNFDIPVPVVFPNLPNPETGELLAPGEKSALWSFNHDTGRWDVIGPMTVSEDGASITTDADVGIKAPGWHGSQPGTSAGGCPGCCAGSSGGPPPPGPGGGPPPPPGDPGSPFDETENPNEEGMCVETDCSSACLSAKISIGSAAASCATSLITTAASPVATPLCFAATSLSVFFGLADCTGECAQQAALSAAAGALSCIPGISLAGCAASAISAGLSLNSFGACLLGENANNPTELNAWELEAQVILTMGDFLKAVTGDELWITLDVSDLDAFEFIMSSIAAANDPDSPDGFVINSDEAQQLLSLPLPPSATQADLDALVERAVRFSEGEASEAELVAISTAAASVASILEVADEAGWNGTFDALEYAIQWFENGKLVDTDAANPQGFFAITDLSTGVTFSGTTNSAGHIPEQIFLGPERVHTVAYYDPVASQIGEATFRSETSGLPTEVPPTLPTSPDDLGRRRRWAWRLCGIGDRH